MKNLFHISARLGKEAELHVAAKLISKGYAPMIPMIDIGTDIVLFNGPRIQVRASSTQDYNPRIHKGTLKVYRFGLWGYSSLENGKRTRVKRDWSKHCDFFVFWCVNENRFFVVPQSFVGERSEVWIRTRDLVRNVIDVEAAKRMRADGMAINAIARHFGVCHLTAKRAIENIGPFRQDDMTRTILQYEDAWHLLDTNAIAEKLVESAQVPEGQEKV